MKVLTPAVFSSVSRLQASGLNLAEIERRPEPASLLMCEPKYFQVTESKNPFMTNNIGSVDPERAMQQWSQLRQIYERLGYPVYTLPPVRGLEDMVFSANQTLPGIDARGQRYVILSHMTYQSRQGEVEHYKNWFSRLGYRILPLRGNVRFEGQGDAIWHPGRKLLWGAHGFRTQPEAYEQIAELTGAPVLSLQLVDPKFYHLDTSLCPLDERTALVYSPAFTPESAALIRQVFDRIIEIEPQDAVNFAGNAVVLGRHVVLQRGSQACCRSLRKLGYEPIEVDTSEFMKSGGSVFCLKLQIYT